MLRLLFCTFVIMLFNASNGLAEKADFCIPKETGIRIDGQPGDWNGKGFDVGIMVPIGKKMKPAVDCGISVQLAWNKNGLLVMARVSDDKFLEDTENPWRKDSLELFLCNDKNGKDLCQWAICPGMDKGGKPTVRFYDMRRAKNKHLPHKIEVARSRIPGGYLMEMLLPWQTLGIKPQQGSKIGFQMWINDCDNGNIDYRAAFFPELGPHKNRNRLYRLELSDKADPSREFTIQTDYNLKKLLAQILITGRNGLTGKSVKVIQEDKLLAKAKLKKSSGYSVAKINMPPLAQGEHYNDLVVKIDGFAPQKVSLPMASLFTTIKQLPARRIELIKKYGIDRPLDKMADAPEIIRRHRGMVALLITLLDNKQKFNGGYKASDKIREILQLGKMLKELDSNVNYLKNMRNEFWSAYYCPVDRSGQHFVTCVPENYDPAKKYPLVISLHGLGGRPKPNFNKKAAKEYLEARPWGRGDTWYTGLGDYDVMQVIDFMCKWYNIDPDRIYLRGGSMGGRGTWVIATRHPDRFAAAAPVCGWADGMFLENLKNVPVFNQHGCKDWAVSIDQSRFAVDQLEKMGYSVAYKEHPEAGHGIPRKYPTIDWMLRLKRNLKTNAITYTCQTPDSGKAYWVSILKFTDPHRIATIKAKFTGYGPQQLLTIKPQNIDVMAIDLAKAPVGKKSNLIVQVGKSQFIRQAPLPNTIYILNRNNKISITDLWHKEKTQGRPYRAGAAANLYTGEPLLIVYGTTGNDAQNKMLKKAAKRLSVHGARSSRGMSLGQIPVISDTEITEKDILYNNLIVLGTTKENSLTARMAGKLPLQINSEKKLIVAKRSPLDMSDSGLRFACRNPLAPSRLVFWIAAFGNEKDSEKWLNNVAKFMTNSPGENRANSSDLIVQSLKGYERRRMQFTHNWKWRQLPGANTLMPKTNALERNYFKALLRAARKNTGADFAFWWGTKKDNLIYDPECFTLADMNTEQMDIKFMTGEISGEELIDIYKRWGQKNKILAEPDYTPKKIDSAKIYTITCPPHLCWMLKGRHKNLRNTRASRPLKMRDFLQELLTVSELHD